MKNKIQNEKAITLITLVVAVSIMIIIASMLIYNAKTGIKMRNLKMMQNDIDLLDNKVDAYYVKYGALPAEIEYNVTPLPFESYKSPNDNDKYYVLDLKAFEGLTLNYGADFSNVTAENVADYTDLYVINEQSHHIYYVRGIEMDGVMYYTNDEDDEVSLNKRKWKLAVENSSGKMYGIDTWGNLFLFNEDYYGTITQNTNYININKIFDNATKEKVQIAAGGDHTVAIDEEGKVYAWGDNYYGQLGDGTTTNSSVPICISDISGNILNGKTIVQIAAGGDHTVAIDEEGKLYTWGHNDNGQLGGGTTTNSRVPICISDISGNALNGKKMIQIATGDSHTVTMDKEGKLYTWGWNVNGQLGDGTTTRSNIPICISDISENALNGKKIVQISAGYNYTVAIDEERKVYTWGENNNGQLGNGTTTGSGVPICISDISGNILNGKKIAQIAAGGYHTIVIDEGGKVYTWGNNFYGQLGEGTTTNSSVPICISDISENALNGKKIVQIEAGNHTIAIDEEGKVYTWGDNSYDQLGNGTYNGSNIPICISDISGNALNGKKIVQIAAGAYYTTAIDEEGKLYTWGCAYDDVLGNETVPICISDISGNVLNGKKIVQISLEDCYLITIDENGEINILGSPPLG